VTKRREEINRQILAGVSEDELRIFREVSSKIRTNIEKMI